MSTLNQRGGMALLLCAALAACSSNRGYDSNGSSTYGSTGSGSATSNSSNSSMGGMGSGTSDMNRASASTDSTASTTSQNVSYGTVQTIEPGMRQDIGVGTLGGAAAGGSVGSPSDKVYRVIVRMDDGSTQSIVLDSMPSSYRVGDRVRYSNGSLQRSQ